MENLKLIPAEVAAIIPKYQLEVTRAKLKVFADCIERLEAALIKCPKLRGTDGLKEHPAIFHSWRGLNTPPNLWFDFRGNLTRVHNL